MVSLSRSPVIRWIWVMNVVEMSTWTWSSGKQLPSPPLSLYRRGTRFRLIASRESQGFTKEVISSQLNNASQRRSFERKTKRLKFWERIRALRRATPATPRRSWPKKKTKQEHYGLKVDGQFFVVKVVDGNELCAYDLGSGKSYQPRWHGWRRKQTTGERQ